jgi:hypothetical protein
MRVKIADFRSGILDRDRVEAMLRTLLAGRAADLEILGFTDAGAADDLATATSMLSDAVVKYGSMTNWLCSAPGRSGWMQQPGGWWRSRCRRCSLIRRH